LIVLQAAAAFSQNPPAKDTAKKKAKLPTAVVTSLPRIPVAVHDALQSRKFSEAITAIDVALKQEKVAAPDYLLYLKGRAQTELKQYPQATGTFKVLEKTHPKSRWLARSRFGQADVLARQRNYRAAGAIYQTEAGRLLSSGRKDELIAIYLEFADRYYEGVAAKDPSAKKQPDYAQALTYYREGIKLSPSLAEQQRIELRIGRCLQELKKYAEAYVAYRNFIALYASEKTKADRRAPAALEVEARYQLGRSLLAGGNSAEAWRVWQDFLNSDIGKKSGGDLLPEAMYGLARTHGIPAPPSIAALEQGVAALEKFVKTYPKSKLAPKASYEIAQSYIHHGRYEDAITRLKAFIAGPYSASEQVATARRLLGQSYFAQKKFTEAIAVWQEFLGKHPTDKNWSAVQKSVVDTEYLMADEQRQRKNYVAARKLWSTFLNKYPLDVRAARVLFEFGGMRYQAAVTQYRKDNEKAVAAGDKPKLLQATQTLFEQAITDWQRLVSKYPGTNEASQAGYMIGVTLEDRLGKLADALKAYQKVTGRYADRTKQRIEKLTSKNLELVTERKFHSDEKPRIRLTTRNLEKVTVKVYRIDLAAYFRKMHLATGVEKLDIALIDPDKSWEYEVAGYEKYKQVQNEVTIPIDGPGVTAVTVVGEKLEATTMVIVSDLDIIVKSSRNELFVFAENVRTGKPAEGVSLLVSDGSKVFAEELTGKDGVLQKSYKELKSVADLRVFAVQEGHAASTVSNLAGLDFAVGLSPKGYLYSDRPAYRAGQLVNLKGVVRWVADDRYVFKEGEKYQLDVYDARGRVIRTQEIKLDKFGTFADRFSLPQSSPQGSYRVVLHQPGGNQSYETNFTVHEYRLEPVRLAVDLPRKVYYRGEKIEGKITLKYYYGTPISGRTIRYRLGGERTHTATTDAKGEVAFEFETRKYSESRPVPFYVEYPERSLATGETIFLATRAFGIGVSTLRKVYIAGETFDAKLVVTDPAGKPVGTKLKLEVFERTLVDGKRGEKLIETHEVTSDEKTGEVRQTLRVEKSGSYIIRATGIDRFKQTISGSLVVAISGEEDSVRLRILADAHHHKVGDTAKVQLHWREKPALALVTFEGAKVLGYRLVQLKTGANPLAIPMESHLAPNFVLSVAVMQGNDFHQASSEFRVSRKLHIKLEPSATTLEPGGDLKVNVTVTDAQGKPVVASVSLGLIQQNLLARFGDTHGKIDAFFSGGYRRPSVRVSTSCRFDYRPTTKGISQFLLAENERTRLKELGFKLRQRYATEYAGRGVPILNRIPATRRVLLSDLDDDDELASLNSQRLHDQVSAALEIAQRVKSSDPDAALQTLRQALGLVHRAGNIRPDSLRTNDHKIESHDPEYRQRTGTH
jgi:TolA-binding protein